MIINDTRYMADEEFRVLVLKSREEAYLTDFEQLDYKLYCIETREIYYRKTGDINASYYHWVTYHCYLEVYEEMEKQQERIKKIVYALDEDSDHKFIASISIENLFGE